MSQPDNGNGGVKTTAIRFSPDRHARLTLIVQLRNSSLQDEVMKAVDAHIAAAKNDPALQELVEQAQADIEREAQERRATLATMFEAAPATPPTTKATGGRAGAKPA